MYDYDGRLQQLSELLKLYSLDYLVLVPGPNLTYLTGLTMHLSERPTVAFLPAEGRPALVLPELEAPRAKGAISYSADFYPYSDEEGHEAAFLRAGADLELSGKTIGVEYLHMRVLELRRLEQIAPDCRVQAAEFLLPELRMIKDETELAHMRQAVRITEAALQATVEQVRPGQTELEIQNILHVEMLRAGAQGTAFGSIVLSGPRTALPHGSASERPLQPGDLLLFDCGATYRGYMGDITRTFAVGDPDPELTAIYEVVKKANVAARQYAGPGQEAQAIDKVARQVIEEAGYGQYFIHRTGHGLGLEVHELPYIVGGNDTVLQPGMTFTIEPGIYLPDKGGIRIEDDVVITAEGCQSLTTFSRDLIRL
ncbi:MAG: aminopeptidase P family protein [Anaerolineae bacterium]|nr:MAG: aminopeptidase P family protein [Anaerolineae bacterium]